MDALALAKRACHERWQYCGGGAPWREQGAVSQRIAELERAAGVVLVHRTIHSARFTEADRLLVGDTRHEFEWIAITLASMREMGDVAGRIVRVTAPIALARQQVVPCLAMFAREYPEVRVQLKLSDKLTSVASEGREFLSEVCQSEPFRLRMKTRT